MNLPKLIITNIDNHPNYDDIRHMDILLQVSGYDVPREEIALLWEYFSASLNKEWAEVTRSNDNILREVLVDLVLTNS